MNDAAKALEEFKTAHDTFYDPGLANDQSDVAGNALMAAAAHIGDLPDSDPLTAYAKLHVLMWRGAVACPEEESGLDFMAAHAPLEEVHLTTIPLPNWSLGAP